MSVLSQFFSQASKLIPIEVLVIGGGGGARGASSTAPGNDGAGAGLFVYDNVFAIAGIPYTINIGSGGAGGLAFGSNGNPTNIPGLGINAFGGQGTGSQNTTESVIYTGSTAGNKSATFSDTVIVPDKIISSNVGGLGAPSTGNGGEGGGGSFSAGNASPPSDAGGSGGDGLKCNCIGYPTLILGGGGSGGNGNAGPITPTQGGAGGGGAGGARQVSGSNGTANTGGGGGGGGGSPVVPTNGGSGGSGVVYIRYPTAYSAATVTGNTPATPQSGYYVYQWNSGPGSITFN